MPVIVRMNFEEQAAELIHVVADGVVEHGLQDEARTGGIQIRAFLHIHRKVEIVSHLLQLHIVVGHAQLCTQRDDACGLAQAVAEDAVELVDILHDILLVAHHGQPV